MNFLIADTFTASFNRLSGQDQKAVKASVFDLQMDPAGNGLQLHRIDKSKDPNFWSARVNRDVRLIVHKTGESLLVAYVGHHDDAYVWAQRRRIEAHPRTGAVQIVEVRERVEEIASPETFDFVHPEPAKAGESAEPPPLLFASLNDDALLSAGVPADWLADVRAASEDGFFALAAHLPAEASEALLEYAATGRLPVAPALPAAADPFTHPDALRRIRLIADQEELEQALAFPWEMGGLSPSIQRALVERTFSGPARVAGSAGTGKTIVAIHRAVRLARENPDARVLLATFSDPLAAALAKKVLVLAPETGGVVPRITTASFRAITTEMFQLEHGLRPRIAGDFVLRERLRAAAVAAGLKGFSERFLLSEWTNVIDAWGITSPDAYSTVQRMGRKSRLGPNQRARLWPVFQAVRDALAAERYTTWADVFTGLADRLARALADIATEAATVRQTVEAWLGEGIAAREIGLFVRTQQLVTRARLAIAGLAGEGEMTTAPMSLAKGLEFRAVVVMACDEGVLPLDERVADAADEAELDDIYETERRLLYVACTRAREHLLLTGVTPVSEYLADFASDPAR
jgi:hypothetical protein